MNVFQEVQHDDPPLPTMDAQHHALQRLLHEVFSHLFLVYITRVTLHAIKTQRVTITPLEVCL